MTGRCFGACRGGVAFFGFCIEEYGFIFIFIFVDTLAAGLGVPLDNFDRNSRAAASGFGAPAIA